MKRAIIVLAVLLMAVTSYTQTSRRSASTNSSARTRENTRVAQTNNNTRQTTNREQTENRSSKSTSTDNRTARSNRSGNNTTYDRNSSTQRTVHVNNNTGTTNQRTTTRTTTTTVNTPVRNTTGVNSKHGHYNHNYTTTRVYRGQHTYHHSHKYVPESREYRAKYYVYREPVHVHVVWTRDLHRHYINMYPSIRHWEYRYGYRIDNVSAYYADYYIGDVKTVYGRVKEVFYARESDEFFLYIGDYYPYQDFTIVLPGHIAREFSRRPDVYFTNEYVDVTGLITEFEGKPEIVVKRNFQLGVY